MLHCGACGNYQLDITGARFGDCKCGFSRPDHQRKTNSAVTSTWGVRSNSARFSNINNDHANSASISSKAVSTSATSAATKETAQPPRPYHNHATTLNGQSPASVPPQAKETVQPPRTNHKHTATLNTQSLVSGGVQVSRGTHLV